MDLPVLLRSAIAFQQILTEKEFRFCVIGGIAVNRWGEPRGTRDVDFTVLTGFGNEADCIDSILADHEPRISNAKEFAILNRVLLVRDSRGIDIDVSLAAMPFEQRAIDRASDFAVATGDRLLTCSASDLVIFKAFAARDQDWIDIEGVLTRSFDQVDWEIVLSELTPLVELKEEPEILGRLQQLRQRARDAS